MTPDPEKDIHVTPELVDRNNMIAACQRANMAQDTTYFIPHWICGEPKDDKPVELLDGGARLAASRLAQS